MRCQIELDIDGGTRWVDHQRTSYQRLEICFYGKRQWRNKISLQRTVHENELELWWPTTGLANQLMERRKAQVLERTDQFAGTSVGGLVEVLKMDMETQEDFLSYMHH